jgi:hypothetical protein
VVEVEADADEEEYILPSGPAKWTPQVSADAANEGVVCMIMYVCLCIHIYIC